MAKRDMPSARKRESIIPDRDYNVDREMFEISRPQSDKKETFQVEVVNCEYLTVRAFPESGSLGLFLVPRGGKFSTTSVEEDWAHVRIDKGLVGYVPSKYLRRV